MSTSARKEREFAQRQELFLETTRQMLLNIGYLNVTMDRIAQETEYSKGTIYQHFSGTSTTSAPTRPSFTWKLWKTKYL